MCLGPHRRRRHRLGRAVPPPLLRALLLAAHAADDAPESNYQQPLDTAARPSAHRVWSCLLMAQTARCSGCRQSKRWQASMWASTSGGCRGVQCPSCCCSGAAGRQGRSQQRPSGAAPHGFQRCPSSPAAATVLPLLLQRALVPAVPCLHTHAGSSVRAGAAADQRRLGRAVRQRRQESAAVSGGCMGERAGLQMRS